MLINRVARSDEHLLPDTSRLQLPATRVLWKRYCKPFVTAARNKETPSDHSLRVEQALMFISAIVSEGNG